jgi:hypothetical protein
VTLAKVYSGLGSLNIGVTIFKLFIPCVLIQFISFIQPTNARITYCVELCRCASF